jgi:EAL domain-containing protein (putative c-di-GMP-specific phosphodiesterase class I)
MRSHPPRDRRSRSSRAGPDVEAMRIVLQPIVDLATGVVVAAEALARFPGEPDVASVFKAAHASGTGLALEAACVRAALRHRDDVPDGALLTVNVSPAALADHGVQDALRGDLSGLVLEINEHSQTDPQPLMVLLAQLRDRGALIAVDDESTGYAALLRLTTLRPDIVKLDRSLVAGLDQSVEQAAVIEAVVRLSHRIDARVLGEGVETLPELIALGRLDVDYAQGWILARPALPLPEVSAEAVAACVTGRRDLLRNAASTAAGSGIALHHITTALAGASNAADLAKALQAAAASLGLDLIGVSTLAQRQLLDATPNGPPEQEHTLALTNAPTAHRALVGGAPIEAHLDDPHTDPGERAWLTSRQLSSLLIHPLIGNGVALGVLGFGHRSHRRWTCPDLATARTLAEHTIEVLLRLTEPASP